MFVFNICDVIVCVFNLAVNDTHCSNSRCSFYSGISRLRGVIMYELQGVLSAYARRKFSSGEISTDHLKNIMKVQS